jgi:hypothetical protein
MRLLYTLLKLKLKMIQNKLSTHSPIHLIHSIHPSLFIPIHFIYSLIYLFHLSHPIHTYSFHLFTYLSLPFIPPYSHLFISSIHLFISSIHPTLFTPIHLFHSSLSIHLFISSIHPFLFIPPHSPIHFIYSSFPSYSFHPYSFLSFIQPY